MVKKDKICEFGGQKFKIRNIELDSPIDVLKLPR